MSRKSFLIIVAILAIAFLCSAVAQQPSPTKIPNAIEPQPQVLQVAAIPGRYQLAAVSSATIVVIDSHTGQCWSGSPSSARWINMGSPVKAQE
jgi:hypothetical protein